MVYFMCSICCNFQFAICIFQFSIFVLKIGVAWSAGEGYHVTDVVHASDQKHYTFHTQPETAVRRCAVTSQIEIPPVVGRIESLFIHSHFEHIEAFLALTAADDLAHFWRKHVHCPDSAPVVV